MSTKIKLINNTYKEFTSFDNFCDYIITRQYLYDEIVDVEINEDKYIVENGVVWNEENFTIVFWLPNLPNNTLIVPQRAMAFYNWFYEKLQHPNINKIVFNKRLSDGRIINYLKNLKEIDVSNSDELVYKNGILFGKEKAIIYGCLDTENNSPIYINELVSEIKPEAFKNCNREIELSKENPYFTIFDDTIYTKNKGTLVAYPYNKHKKILTFPKELWWTPIFEYLPECFENFVVESGSKYFKTLTSLPV